MIWHAEMSYRVPYADTDQMGVVYYANFFVYFERVRNEVLRELGVTYLEFEAGGHQLPVRKAHCDYKAPAKYDDLLTIRGRFEVQPPFVRMEAHCQILRDERVLATGFTEHVCINRDSGRPTPLPETVVHAINTYATRTPGNG
jgi:acyl-CoA thioester hydrolase